MFHLIKQLFYGTIYLDSGIGRAHDARAMMTSTIKTVALYARVSTKDKGQDTANQLRQLRDFCSKQGWTITAEYVDRASGKRSDREQFQRMFDGAFKREFDCISLEPGPI